MKVYDSVDWGFLFDTMVCMGFPSLFVHWVRKCVTSAKYFVVINGSLEGNFPGQRGLRRGDPISPYLFLLVMEALLLFLSSEFIMAYLTITPNAVP